MDISDSRLFELLDEIDLSGLARNDMTEDEVKYCANKGFLTLSDAPPVSHAYRVTATSPPPENIKWYPPISGLTDAGKEKLRHLRRRFAPWRR